MWFSLLLYSAFKQLLQKRGKVDSPKFPLKVAQKLAETR